MRGASSGASCNADPVQQSRLCARHRWQPRPSCHAFLPQFLQHPNRATANPVPFQSDAGSITGRISAASWKSTAARPHSAGLNQIESLLGPDYPFHDIADKYGEGSILGRLPLHQGKSNGFPCPPQPAVRKTLFSARYQETDLPPQPFRRRHAVLRAFFPEGARAGALQLAEMRQLADRRAWRSDDPCRLQHLPRVSRTETAYWRMAALEGHQPRGRTDLSFS